MSQPEEKQETCPTGISQNKFMNQKRGQEKNVDKSISPM